MTIIIFFYLSYYLLGDFMSVIRALIISTMAGLSTVIGSLIIFFNINPSKLKEFITFCISFSIAIMIGISITDLLPTSFFYIMFNYNWYIGIIITLLSFFIGVLLVIIINKLLQLENESLLKIGILSMIALMIHNFPEGIATFMGSIKDTTLGLKLSFAIMLHNIPEGIAIAVPIYYATNSKKKAVLNTFLSGIAEPLGAIFAFLFLKNYINDTILNMILLLVSGIMISMSINEMLPKALSYNKPKYIYLGLLLGIILITLNHFII